LSIVAAISRAHGGSCRALNSPSGQGTLFEMRFPLPRADAAESEDVAGPPFAAEPALGAQS
jgi:hypothetical protein